MTHKDNKAEGIPKLNTSQNSLVNDPYTRTQIFPSTPTKINLLVFQIFVVIPESLSVDLELRPFPSSLVQQFPGVGKLVLVHGLDVRNLPRHRLLGGLDLPG